MTHDEFISKVAAYVKKYAARYGILVHSPIIAQAILESGWGESTLAAKYHNYFGLKCGSKWTGKSVNLTTQEEYTVGTYTTIKDNFRVYDSMEDGVKGYFEFIQLTRYQNLKGITDPRKYLETIKADGYATSSTYVESNMKLVEQYGLTKYDTTTTEGDADMSNREKPGNYLKQYIGIKEGSAEHKAILKVFNDSGLCSRYKMTVNDAWCATAVSAAFIATGLTDIFPCVECGCERMVTLAKNAGIWVENDAYVPATGDVILYDWDDSGSGDNTGNSDHVGIVVSVSGSTIKVIEGNKTDTVGYRSIAVNGKYIRGFICPKYDTSGGTVTNSPSTGKSVAEVAQEVLAGKWGNGDARKTALTNAGYDYAAVQAAVNQLVNGKTTTPSKSVEEVAKEVINGKWGNGDARKTALENAGYNYSEVQAKVNELLKSSGTATKSITEIAKEVIAGKWGNGADRKTKLTAAGYDYSAVQKKVNQLLS